MAVRPITFQPFATASAHETRKFLTTHSLTDNELMRELWNTFSGLPGLLQARLPHTAPPLLRRGERDYIYNPATGKYRRVDTNRTVGEAELRRAVFKVTTEVKNRMRETTKEMMAGTILFLVWYHRMRSLLKAMYRAIWTIALGGALFDDESARNAFYLWSILMFEQFDQFKIGIETGTVEWNGRIRTTAGGLARKGNGMYQNAKLEIGRRKGHNEAMRVLGENENHCHDSKDRPGCIELADLGWVPISQIVPIGDATCRCISTPDSRIFTKDGWKTFLEIEIGDLVLTHKMRFRRVTAVHVKLSQNYHRQIYVKSPTGVVVGATDTHLWYTADGWKDGYYIYNNPSKVFNIGKEISDDKNLFDLQEYISPSHERGLLSPMPSTQDVQVWGRDRSQGKTVQTLCLQANDNNTMEEFKESNAFFHSEGWNEQADSLRGFVSEYQMDCSTGRASLHKILGRQKGKVSLHLPLSMGLDQGEWTNTGWISIASQERNLFRRRTGKSGIDSPARPRRFTLKDKPNDPEAVPTIHLSKLQKGISCRKEGNRKVSSLLFDKMPLGTLLYDITVEEDHSYCIEGIFSHNSNCMCQIRTRKRPNE